MKTILQNSAEFKVLKRNTKLQSNQLYLLSSESVANNLYFENKQDIQFTHQMIKKYVGYIGDVIDYLIKPTGWVIILRTHSESTILSKFKKKINKSATIKKAIRNKKVSVLMSETIRIIISSITRQINRNNNRKGTIVKGNFSRYVFKSVVDAINIIKKMKNEKLEIIQQIKKYQADVSNWKKKFNAGKGRMILCSKNRQNKMVKGLIPLSFLGNNFQVLRELFQNISSPFTVDFRTNSQK